MARISIDDELHADRRFKRLERSVGDEDKAIGMLYRFWRIAQDFWADGKLIPEEEFDAEKLQPILDAGLAEKREDGIYAHGAEQRFAWYVAKVKGGESTKKKWAEKKQAVPEEASAEAKPVEKAIAQTDSAKAETVSAIIEPKPSLLTSSLRFSSLLTAPHDTDKKGEASVSIETSPPAPCDLQTLWNLNRGPLPKIEEMSDDRRKSWRARWKAKPDRDYWVSAIKRLAASPFLTGENERGWKANVDFFLRPNTHLKIMEGYYDRTLGKRRPTQAEIISQANAELYAAVERGEA